MTIDLNDATEALINQCLKGGEFASREELVQAAVEFYFSYEAAELADIRAAVEEGHAQAERGHLTPIDQVFAELKAERAVSR